ncbi:MAG: hypothetical protein RLZZ628_422 [Bacteroidota bacterium]|jgi:hypothetical protein
MQNLNVIYSHITKYRFIFLDFTLFYPEKGKLDHSIFIPFSDSSV